MVKSQRAWPALLLCAAACTNYVDAILPPTSPDGGTQMDVEPKVDTDADDKPPVVIDPRFGQDGIFALAVSANDQVVDAFIAPGGTTYVLLKDSCTLVAVTDAGRLEPKFGKGGVLRGDSSCVGARMTFDVQSKRILVITDSNPNSIILAYNLDGSPSGTLADGSKVKIDFATVSSVLPRPKGMLIAGTDANTGQLTVAALDLSGAVLNRETIATNGLPGSALLYAVSSGDILVLAQVPNPDPSIGLDSLIAPVTEFAKVGLPKTVNTLGTTGGAILSVVANTAGIGGQVLVLGEGWLKGTPKVRQPLLWALNDMGFGDTGVATLPQGVSTVYTDMAFDGSFIAVVGDDGIKGDRRPVLTMLDSRGSRDSHFAQRNLFTLPLPDASTAAKVLFTPEGAVLLVGSLGFEGNASLFVSRLVLN